MQLPSYRTFLRYRVFAVLSNFNVAKKESRLFKKYPIQIRETIRLSRNITADITLRYQNSEMTVFAKTSLNEASVCSCCTIQQDILPLCLKHTAYMNKPAISRFWCNENSSFNFIDTGKLYCSTKKSALVNFHSERASQPGTDRTTLFSSVISDVFERNEPWSGWVKW